MAQRVCIGVFDSGAGGLGVLFECLRLSHGVRYFYLSDEAHAPYGSRTEQEIASYVREGLQIFEALGVDAAVLACNTATAACVEEMRRAFPFPVVGTEPAVRLAERAGCKHALVLVTPRTAQCARFRALLAREKERFTVFSPPRLASAVDRFVTEGERFPLSDHLPRGTFDGVVLGCTHYTLVKDEIAAFYASPVFDGNPGTARRVLSLAGRDGQPPAGNFDHRKGGLTTNKRSAQECEPTTKNEVFFLNSPKIYNKLHDEHMFSMRFPSKTVIFSQMSENFFDFSPKKWS